MELAPGAFRARGRASNPMPVHCPQAELRLPAKSPVERPNNLANLGPRQ
jgi:hypothetical protein